jgi:hypothetical protein
MTYDEILLDTSEYESEDEFMEDVYDALDEQNSIFIYGDKHTEYAPRAVKAAHWRSMKENLKSQISLNPFDWLRPDIYRVSEQETEEGVRINYVEL